MNSNHKTQGRRRAPLALAVVVLASALRGGVNAQLAPPDLVSARSYSGQFVSYADRSVTLPPAVLSLATNRDFVQLEPNLATVSCERIKQVLLRELDSTAPWRGTIYLVLYPAKTGSDTINIVSQRFKSGWQYRVDFPDVVERTRYVRAMVQVLLSEQANRAARERAAEIPLWLVEGFAQLLLASSEVELVLAPPRANANGLSFSATLLNTRKESLLQQAQRKLHGRPPLTFERLSWPADEDLVGEAGDLYCGSAQLFVGELLRLPEGRGCLRAMLAQLPQHYNWQFAFLGAFHTRFERPLDVEKWWALALTEAIGRGLTLTWSLEESRQKLDQAVQSAVQVRTGTNELPLHAEVTLQKIIREWDPVRQAATLNNMLRELGLLRLRIAQEYVGLVQDYCQVIETYLQQLDRSRSGFLVAKRAARRRAVEAAVAQLDALDARRMALRPAPRAIAATPAAPPVR